MNFAAHQYYNNFNRRNNKKKAIDDEFKENFNMKIIDSIIEDNDEDFKELLKQIFSESNDINQSFTITKYKLPDILRYNPPYFSVCAYFGSEKCFDSISMFMPDGLCSDQVKKEDDYGRSAMHFACAGGSLSIIRDLDQAGFSFDEVDRGRYSPAHYAAMTGNIDTFKYLWMKGVDVATCRSWDDMTPLHVASLYGNLNIVEFLCEKVVGDDQNGNKNKNKNKNENKNENENENEGTTLHKLLNFSGFHSGYCMFSTPLHLACEGGHSDVLKYLLSKKDLVEVQINSLDRHSRTPLLVACCNGSLNCIKLLIETGLVKFNKKNRKHYPLIDACAGGFVDVVRYLVSLKDIKIDMVNSQKLDAISVAVHYNYLDVVKVLVDNGALKKYDDEKLGELFIRACATDNVDLIKYLDKKAKIPYDKISHQTFSKWQYSHNVELDEKLTWGTKFMQQAVMIENQEIVLFLLSKKITFACVDFSFNTKKKWNKFMDFLISNGLDLSESSDNCPPPIVAAIYKGNLKNINKMISKGAKIDKDIISKYDLVYQACCAGRIDLFEFLMSFKPDVKNAEECVDRCMNCYGRNAENKRKMAKYLLDNGYADVNKPCTNYSNETLVSRAVSSMSTEFLEFVDQYGVDYSKIPLRFDQLSLNSYDYIIDFLNKKGCTFDVTVNQKRHSWMGSMELKTPLEQCFYFKGHPSFNKEFPLIIMDHLSNEEINDFIKGNKSFIIENFMSLNMPEGLLKLYKICDKVVPPNDIEKFKNWVLECGNTELINMVLDKI